MSARATALTLAALLLATPSVAQDHVGKIMPVLDTALSEWRVFLTCTSLDPQMHPLILSSWASTIELTSTFLRAEGFPASVVASFSARAQPEVLMLPGDTPFSEVSAFCNAQPDWRWRLDTFSFTMLPNALEEALAQ